MRAAPMRWERLPMPTLPSTDSQAAPKALRAVVGWLRFMGRLSSAAAS
jgi:hypothetical protein